ncbi:MAG: acetyl-CoA carboxylase biotin carboxyl carrier protein subunit [Clostridia bacterium]|nr:acetyl-CoA carboxylase biotin carboxyl carrier protein subunit [Clostridia bacterium]
MRNFVVTIDGKSYSVGVEEVAADGSAAPAVTNIAPKAVEQTKKAEPAPKAAAATVKGEEVKSPFPGLIKNILVESGAQVKKNQPIVVLEAMKMDNDITAPCDGTVTINVNKGANVDTGAVLAVIS